MGSTFEPGTNRLTINGDLFNFSGGTINVGAGTFTENYSKTPYPASGTTVNYNAQGAQTISNDFSYFNLIASGSGTKSITRNAVVNGNLTIASNAILALSGNLNLSGNFLNDGVFSHNAGTFTFLGTERQGITGTASGVTFKNLTLNNTSSSIPQLTFGMNVTAEDALNMTAGIVDLGGNTFTLGRSNATSSLARTGSTTNNWMYAGTFKRFWPSGVIVNNSSDSNYGLFPVGAMGASAYRPVVVTSDGAISSSGGSFSVRHSNGTGFMELNPTYDDAGVSINGLHNAKFLTSASGISAGTFSISVTMAGLVEDLETIRLAKYASGTTATTVGKHAPASGNAESLTARRIEITNPADLTGDFRIARASPAVDPLPVTLLYFKVNTQGKNVQLNWATASELNNSYFKIERSHNALDWEPVGKVKGAGTSALTLTYTFTDTSPLVGASYYRLKQIDYSGDYSYSKIVSVNINETRTVDFKLYPNPGRGIFKIDFDGQQHRLRFVEVYDSMGRKVYQTHHSEINLTEKEGGVYYVRFFLDDDTEINKTLIKY